MRGKYLAAFFTAIVFSGSWCGSLKAAITMPGIFGDHMVLQEKKILPVWGWASPGESVTVVFKDQKVTTTAKLDGTWRVDLQPLSADDNPAVMTVSGKNTIVFEDVLVGDVWLASGQSNMEFGLQKDSRAAEMIPKATDAKIRMFFVPWATALEPQTNIAAKTLSPLDGKWQVCSPEVMRTNWAFRGFSAVGFYFATDLRKAVGKPLGMISAYKGGTPAQAWTSISGLGKDETLQHYVEKHQEIRNNYSNAVVAFPKKLEAHRTALKKWNADAAKAKVEGHPLSPQSAPKAPVEADGGHRAPGNLFNGMIAPLMPFAIKGVIWYQGEGNGMNVPLAREYATLFPRMISDWREQWGQGDFPFLFVQLPNFNSPVHWPWVREAQLKALALPNTGMAVTTDIGEADDLHPPDKIYVGKRLALVARQLVYGENIVTSGPLFHSMQREGNKIRLRFKNGGGLKMGVPPPPASGKTFPPPTELKGFGIAGSDRKFISAEAVIDGDTVLVSSDQVLQPTAVRYNWAQNPEGNLYNAENLPAAPFRTDDWLP